MRLARTAAPLPRFTSIWPAGIEPAVSGARSRRGGLLPHSQMKAPPAGLEPAASGLRARRHRQFDHGGKSSSRSRREAAAEPGSAGREATPAEDVRLRRQDSNLRFAINSRASHHSTTPERDGRGGSRTPKAGKGPPVFETGYRTSGSPSRVAPAGVEPATARVRIGSSAELSYGAGETCGRQGSNLRRPAFQASALPLSYSHENSQEWAEPESNRRPPPHQRGALPSELSAYRWAWLDSNQPPPLCKRGALPAELHARELRDKDSNLDRHVQSVVSCR
jgi:hypothetical protein